MILSLFLLLFQAPTGQLSYQDMLDVAEPGSVVVLPQGPAPGQIKRLRIEKPLTIIGAGWGASTSGIILDGPGSGAVVLQNVHAGHRHFCDASLDPVCNDYYEWAPHRYGDGAIVGGGFDEIHLHQVFFDGGSDLRVDRVFVFEKMGHSYHDNYSSGTVYHPDGNGVFTAPSCVDALSFSGALRAGPGWRDLNFGRIGHPIEFEWTELGYGILWASQGVRAPRLDLGGQHWIFLDDAPLFVKLGQRARVPIPARRDLIGLEVTFQATDFGGRYSSPAFALIRP